MLKRILSFGPSKRVRNAAVLTAVVLTASAFAKMRNASNPSGQFFQQIAVSDRVTESEVITLRPTGFEPSELTRAAGEFLLTINNRTGLEEINLTVSTDFGGIVRNFRANEGRLRSGGFQVLPPGRYVITETEHPEWICRITITPN